MDFLGIDLIALIKAAGYLGVFGIIFAESGLLVGFFLPGDSLLFTAGFLASQGFLHFPLLVITTFVAAVIGDSVGYWFGSTVGPKIFKREDSLLFHKDHIARARAFYQKHGGKAIILARFMPVVRTFTPILAGVGQMRYPAFLFYNIIGGILWAVGLPFVGYFLGETIPGMDRYLLPIVIGIIVLSLSPGIIHVIRRKQERKRLLALFKEKITANERLKRIVGIICVIVGFIALITPFTPGSWLLFVGFELLGMELLQKFWQRTGRKK